MSGYDECWPLLPFPWRLCHFRTMSVSAASFSSVCFWLSARASIVSASLWIAVSARSMRIVHQHL
jgi:hypothetical protein